MLCRVCSSNETLRELSRVASLKWHGLDLSPADWHKRHSRKPGQNVYGRWSRPGGHVLWA